ncbi:autotransporter outer membrane beta-barrel domain-containing protein [Pseudomonas abietaniphila]|uniref:autotransporter outer membrane beta-barrel domain-containing protein n=1 Tax=Pseudomonas abietaniphila TaxID=89065 RepID=UPI0009E21BC4
MVRNNGHLNLIAGATADAVRVDKSTLRIDSSAVRKGVQVASGNANINNSTIQRSDGIALELFLVVPDVLTPTTARVAKSVLSGVGYGVLVAGNGELWLADTNVEGIGYGPGGNGGLTLNGGAVHITDGSHVIGDDRGIHIADGTRGLLAQRNRVEIDNSTVSGRKGAAIEVGKNPNTQNSPAIADIYIGNNAVLEAGNGRLIDVNQEGTASVEVNNSRLSGDFVADGTSVLDVILRNHARLDGNIINGNSLIIDSRAHWQLAADNSIKSLSMDGGSVGFSEDAFHTLTVGELSGRGVFDMRINLDNGSGDLLNVTGAATGKHWLNIRNTGVEAIQEEFDALRVVHTGSGDAAFALVGGRADLGVYSYALEQQGNDWFIVGSGKIISPSTQSALALFSAGPTIWNSELTTLRSRMGEVRGQEQGGGWIRSYGNRFKASLDAGVDYQQKQQGLSFGADAPIPVSNGHLLVGLMGGYSKSDLDMSRGTSGEVDSYYVGAYGTWLSDEGYYVDGVVKLNQFHNASKVAMSDGSKAKGDYSNMAVGGSVEFGKHIKLPDDYFVAPYAQLSSVWVEGNSYTLDNGLQARTRQTQSVLGKVGTTVGRQFTLKDGGVVQPYVRVALAHEFSRGNDVSVNDQRFDNDLFGSRGELGAGVSVSLSERLQVHADFDYMKGEHVEQPWGANLGLRFAF